MTREERDKVISILQWLHDNDFLFRSTEEDVKYATKLAIQELQKEPSISEDGTLTVNVEDGNKVSRVLVCGDNHFGGLYYPEQEPCKDTISRQAVIDAVIDRMTLEEVIETLQVWIATADYEYDLEEMGRVFGLKEALHEIQKIKPCADDWIPVSERLPEEDGQYLITVKYVHVDGYDDIYAEHGEWIDGKWDMFCFGHCGQVETILAWMPLPEPYKAESEDKE